MKRKRRICGVLMMATAPVIMQLPISEADAGTSASDFKIVGSALAEYRDMELDAHTNIELDTDMELPEYEDVFGYGTFDLGRAGAAPSADGSGNVLGTTYVVGNRAFFIIGSSQMNVQGMGQETDAWDVPAADAAEYDWDGIVPKYTVIDKRIVADQAYYRNMELDRVSLAVGISEIGELAYARSSLSEIVLPYGVQKIGYGAFYHCDGLESVTIPETVMCVEPKAFSHSLWVDSFLAGGESAGRSEDSSTGGESAGRSEDSSTGGESGRGSGDSLADGEFGRGSGNSSADGESAGQSEDSSADGESGRGSGDSLDGEASGERAGDFLIEGGVLVAYRGKGAMVVIPDDVRVIAGEAFYGHGEITEVTLPEGLLVIGEGAFEGCGSLKRINLGESVEEIKDRAFRGTDVKEVVLPASVKALGLMAFGDADITYEGEEPERTYETSATRLSNAAYRVYDKEADGDGQEAGVTVVGMEGVFASLTGADRKLTLTVGQCEDAGALARAALRSVNVRLPEDMTAYDLTLTDGSGIPLAKLGQQTLTAAFPVPEGLAGQKLKILSLDRNGQLEVTAAERVLMDGEEYFRFQTNYLSPFGLIGTGMAEEGELLELQVDMESLSAPPQEPVSPWHGVKLWAAGMVLTGGVYLALSGRGKRRMP